MKSEDEVTEITEFKQQDYTVQINPDQFDVDEMPEIEPEVLRDMIETALIYRRVHLEYAMRLIWGGLSPMREYKAYKNESNTQKGGFS